MNIVFFGSDNFSLPALKALASSGHKISCVVTQPDRQKGRGLSLQSTAVEAFAKELGLKVYQPESVNDVLAVKFLKSLKADLFIVIAYGQILSREVLSIPRLFPVNIHASLLPAYRGASPINYALMNGEKITGVTLIKMAREMDAGPIILEKKTDIFDDDNFLTLEAKLAHLAAGALVDLFEGIENENYKLSAQEDDKASYAPKLKKQDGLIDWAKSALDTHNLIRGCFVWPGSFTYYQGKLLKIYKASINRDSAFKMGSLPGEIIEVSKDSIVVVCGKDSLSIEELQLEGKKRMKVAEFAAGHKIRIGEILGNLKK